MPMRPLNLLLKQQIVRQVNQTDTLVNFYAMNRDADGVECEERFDDENDMEGHDNPSNLYYEDIKMELASIQIEESVSTEKHKTIRDSYHMIENLMEHLLHHIECVILELNSSNRLVQALKYFSQHNGYSDEVSAQSLKILGERSELRILEEAKTKLLTSLTNNDDTQTLFKNFEERKNNYNLALKNFRIILEILDLPEDSLLKLKDQFEDVLVNYQHSRRILDQQLPYVIAEKSRTLSEILVILSQEYVDCYEIRKELAAVLKIFAGKLDGCGYFSTGKEVSCSKKVISKNC